jgi:hypothetical protein
LETARERIDRELEVDDAGSVGVDLISAGSTCMTLPDRSGPVTLDVHPRQAR